jgi:hypothetical protein
MADDFQIDGFLSLSASREPVPEPAARLKRDGLGVWLGKKENKYGDSIPTKMEEGQARTLA